MGSKLYKLLVMSDYLVGEIAGRQYTVTPDAEFTVDSLGDIKTLECDKVLLLADQEDLKVGNPYLKEKLVFDILEHSREKKIRVAKFHAKANHRKVTGSRRSVTKIRLQAQKETKSREK